MSAGSVDDEKNHVRRINNLLRARGQTPNEIVRLIGKHVTLVVEIVVGRTQSPCRDVAVWRRKRLSEDVS
jgi:hypothetical protein